MHVVTVAQMRAIEAEAARGYGLTGPILMARAGASAAEIARDWLDGAIAKSRWLFLIGPGNNGGDGRVMAGHLADDGAEVTLYDWKDNTLTTLKHAGMAEEHTVEATDLHGAITAADVVVDALLGIGHARPLNESMIAVNKLVRSEHMRRGGHPRIIALDLPSGLDADTGAIDIGTLAADLTITLGYPKIGLLRYPGAAYVGELRIGSIGLPPAMASECVATLVTRDAIAELLPSRPFNSHKGTYGKALIVAGSPAFPGAALLAGTAAGRTGAGLVTLAVEQWLIPAYVGPLPEAVYVVLPEDAQGRVTALRDGMRGMTAMLIGPGLGQSDATRTMLRSLLATLAALPNNERPRLIIDADGLNFLSQEPEWWKLLPPQTVLTPHLGEMQRLMGNKRKLSPEGSEGLAIVREQAQAWGHVIVLKGALTIIAAPEGEANTCPWLNYAPNPAMSTAGSGDVLAGTIVGLLAQGAEPFAAAVAGVALHSEAGKLGAFALGHVQAGMLAADIAQCLPEARLLFTLSDPNDTSLT